MGGVGAGGGVVSVPARFDSGHIHKHRATLSEYGDIVPTPSNHSLDFMKKYILILFLGIGLFALPHQSRAAIIFDDRFIPTSTENLYGDGIHGTSDSNYTNSTYWNTGISLSAFSTGVTYYWGGYAIIGCGSTVTCTSPGGLGPLPGGAIKFDQTTNDTATQWQLQNQTPGFPAQQVVYATGTFIMDNVTPFSGITTEWIQVFGQNGVNISAGGSIIYNGTWTANELTGATMNICIADDPTSCSGLPSGGTPSISFIYPVGGSTTPPFSPWELQFNNLTSTDSYWSTIHWIRTDNGCGNSGIPGYPYQYCQLFSDTSNSFTSNSTDPLLKIARPDRNLGFQYDKYTQDTWTATAYLYDNTYGNQIVATSSINFTMLRGAGDYGGAIGAVGTTTFIIPDVSATGTLLITTSTNSYIQPVINSPNANNTSSSTGCAPAADWTDVGGGISYGLCTATDQLFTPSNAYTADITQSFTNIQGDFPFNFVYGTIGQIGSAASVANAATGTLSLPLFTSSIPILSSSTLEGFVGTSNKNMIFQTEDSVAWVSVAWAGLKLIF